MGLNFGEPPSGKPETKIFENQTTIMQVLLIVVLASVPLMLFVKPVYEYSQAKKHHHDH